MTSNVTVSTSVINNATVTVNGVSWSAQQGQTEVTIDPLLVGEPVGSVLDWKEERQKRRARILARQADESSQLDKKQERLDKKQERQAKKQERQQNRLDELDKSNVTLTSNNGQLVTENATVTVNSKPDSADVTVTVGGTGGVVTITATNGCYCSVAVCNNASETKLRYRRECGGGWYMLLNEDDNDKPVWEGPYQD